jgi:hypothetical protein
VGVIVDPKNVYPDVRRENNRWKAAVTSSTPTPGNSNQ